jgi:hypothetical protein
MSTMYRTSLVVSLQRLVDGLGEETLDGLGEETLEYLRKEYRFSRRVAPTSSHFGSSRPL